MDPTDTEVQILFEDGSSLQTTVTGGTPVKSLAAVFKEQAEATNPADLAKAILGNLASFDAGWWSFLDDAVAQMRASHGYDAAQTLVMRGRYICDLILIHGSDRQLAAASEWWNRYLVASLEPILEQCAFAGGSAGELSAALQADGTARAAIAQVTRLWPALRREGNCSVVLDLLLQNASWLDEYFFTELGGAMRGFQEESRLDLARRCFLLGGLAAAVVLDQGTAEQYAASVSFIERFPEVRFGIVA